VFLCTNVFVFIFVSIPLAHTSIVLGHRSFVGGNYCMTLYYHITLLHYYCCCCYYYYWIYKARPVAWKHESWQKIRQFY